MKMLPVAVLLMSDSTARQADLMIVYKQHAEIETELDGVPAHHLGLVEAEIDRLEAIGPVIRVIVAQPIALRFMIF
jgi:hypothetical protein